MNDPSHLLPRSERLRLRVEDFELLSDNGAFADYAKTELIDGDIYVMNAQYSRHARAKGRLYLLIGNHLAKMGGDLEVMSEVSVRVADDSMPEPDIVVTRYRGDRAVPGDTVALVIEVSDSTLDIDLGRKADLYAAAGIAEYWVFDLEENRVLMHERPDPDGYPGQLDVPFGEVIGSVAVEGLQIETSALIG